MSERLQAFIGWCDYFAIQSPWGTTRMLLKGLRPHPHKTGHFSTRIFVYPDSRGQSLKRLCADGRADS